MNAIKFKYRSRFFSFCELIFVRCLLICSFSRLASAKRSITKIWLLTSDNFVFFPIFTAFHSVLLWENGSLAFLDAQKVFARTQACVPCLVLVMPLNCIIEQFLCSSFALSSSPAFPADDNKSMPWSDTYAILCGSQANSQSSNWFDNAKKWWWLRGLCYHQIL